jgi:hypothetical protein
VVKALKNSKDYMLKGLQINGYYLTCHSAIRRDEWQVGGKVFKLFGKPGTVFVPKTYDDVIYSGEYMLFQHKTVATAIGAFRRDNDSAKQLVLESRQYIDEIYAYLSEEDKKEFDSILRDSGLVINVLRLLGETAYAANLVLDNFDAVEEPRALLKDALDTLEKHNDTVIYESKEEIFNAPIYENVRDIAASYRGLLRGLLKP